MNEDQTKELFTYCIDHAEHFGGLPMDFEMDGIIWGYDEFRKELSKERRDELNAIMAKRDGEDAVLI